MPASSNFLLQDWLRNKEEYTKSSLTGSAVTPLSLTDLEAFSTTPISEIINADAALGYRSNQGSQLLRERIAEAVCAPVTSWGAGNYAEENEVDVAAHTQSTSTLTTHAVNGTAPSSTQPITAHDILVTTATSAANLLVLDYLLGPGDHVVVQFPTYGALYEIPKRAGADVTLWRMKEENGWMPVAEELEALVRKGKTKMIILNNPHNPTGAATPLATLEAIAEICDKYSLIFFCDEIFRPLFHAPPTRLLPSDKPPPTIHALPLHPHTPKITTGSLSKSYGLPGLRIGWIACSPSLRPLLTQLVGAAGYTILAVSALDDQVATYVLRSDVRRKVLRRNLGICEENLKLWDGFVKKYEGGRNGVGSVEWIRPRGAGTGWLRVRAANGALADDVAFATSLVEETGLLTIPGGGCFISDWKEEEGEKDADAFRGYLRVAIVNKPEDTKRALEILEARLQHAG